MSHPEPSTPRRRRADAERSMETILDAAYACILADGDVTMSAVARAAGLSRVTLYSHFPTREALIEAVLRRAVASSASMVDDARLDQGTATAALARLIESSWVVLSSYRRLHAAASSAMPPACLRKLHEPLMSPVRTLLVRGRDDGDFRADLPLDWMVATILDLLHLAAQEVDAGRLSLREAGRVVSATVVGALSKSP